MAKIREEVAAAAFGVYRLACYPVEVIFRRMIGTTCGLDWETAVKIAISTMSLLLVAAALVKQSGRQKSSMTIKVYCKTVAGIGCLERCILARRAKEYSPESLGLGGCVSR